MSLKPALSDLEQQLMHILWSRRNATAADIRDTLAPERPLKDSTIRTVLTRLEEKGYVRHKVRGRTFVYSGIEHPRKVAVRAVKQIIDRFCHGSVESLLAGMVDGEMVDPEELQRIAAQLAGNRLGKSK
ncbi:MAG TPA: BlaI/MecI/CopY family transcriptional regulator [Bryobacteraceae bacterium]|jgi:predicted transcriptional regulator